MSGLKPGNPFLLVEAKEEISMGVLLNPTGHLLVPDTVADTADIRVKTTDCVPVQFATRGPETLLAVLKVEGAKDLRPVEMGTVEHLKEYAPYDFTMVNGHSIRTFSTIVLYPLRLFKKL